MPLLLTRLPLIWTEGNLMAQFLKSSCQTCPYTPDPAHPPVHRHRRATETDVGARYRVLALEVYHPAHILGEETLTSLVTALTEVGDLAVAVGVAQHEIHIVLRRAHVHQFGGLNVLVPGDAHLATNVGGMVDVVALDQLPILSALADPVAVPTLVPVHDHAPLLILRIQDTAGVEVAPVLLVEEGVTVVMTLGTVGPDHQKISSFTAYLYKSWSK